MGSFFGEIDGTGFEILTEEFNSCVTGHGRVERLWTGARWVEGPVWFPAGRFLLFSDIPNNRMLRWDETNGLVSEFRNPSSFSNGNTRDLQGRLITCQHLSRSVTRTEHSGEVTSLASHFDGKRLNSPNDAVVKSDGSIWFTDPDYGIMSDYEGRKSPCEQSSCNVFRIDQKTGNVDLITNQMVKPNGLCFNKIESKLYVSDTGGSHVEGGPRNIYSFDLTGDTVASASPELFAECSNGLFDGFRIDSEDRIWTSAADGVHCYNSVGVLIGKIKIPEIVSNVCFGGERLNRLFIMGTTSLYSAYLAVNGIR
ncbi:MAG: SMP-30/gluconolactonase/LRE family protein [Paracoccaceae bacterium]